MTTRFPDDPEDHRLYRELEAAGHEYYFNVRAGVTSRVLGILPQTEAHAALEEIKRRWPDIDRLDSVERIAGYLSAHGLNEVGERVEATARENQSNAPPDGVDHHLAAAAVKQGLIDAAFEIEAVD